MESSNIEMPSEGVLVCRGRLPCHVESCPHTLLDLLKALVERIQDLKKLYGTFLLNDGKLAGQERADLVEQLDQLLNIVIFIRYLFNQSDEFVISSEKHGHRITINLKGDRWEGHGFLGARRNVDHSRFTHWLENNLEAGVRQLLEKYGESLKDGVIDNAEKVSLNQTLNHLIFGLILAHEKILSASMH